MILRIPLFLSFHYLLPPPLARFRFVFSIPSLWLSPFLFASLELFRSILSSLSFTTDCDYPFGSIDLWPFRSSPCVLQFHSLLSSLLLDFSSFRFFGQDLPGWIQFLSTLQLLFLYALSPFFVYFKHSSNFNKILDASSTFPSFLPYLFRPFPDTCFNLLRVAPVSPFFLSNSLFSLLFHPFFFLSNPFSYSLIFNS